MIYIKNKLTLGNATLDDLKLIELLKRNKLLQDKDVDKRTADYIKAKINVQNSATHYQISSIFRTPKLVEVTSDYIQRCFTMVAKTDKFLQLDFQFVNKLLSSSDLNVSSEEEVFHAADRWLSCGRFDRSKFVKDVFFKIRFPLLFDNSLKSVLEKPRGLRNSSSFHKNDECLVFINNILENKEDFYKDKSSSYYINRYCNSSMFNILFCGGTVERCFESIHLTEGNNIQTSKLFAKMTEKKYHVAACVNGDLYIIGNRVDENRKSVLLLEKYSTANSTWNILFNVNEDRLYFCVCSLIDRVFVIGGFFDDVPELTNSCIEFNVTSKKWKNIARMNQVRSSAACTVFEGNVVISGGRNIDIGNMVFEISNTVEAYDHVADSWSDMPNMVHARYCHELIAVSNKLFAIGGDKKYSEVYDSFSKKFVALKQHPNGLNFELNAYAMKAVSSCRKILVFGYNSSTVVSYDIDEEKWEEESCEVTKTIEDYRIVKIPQI